MNVYSLERIKMRKILLVCSAGMSTSMLVRKMEEAAKKQNYEVYIEAHAANEVRTIGLNWDVILLGPQVRFQLKDFKSFFPNKPIDSIEMRSYGRMDGESVLNQAKTLLKD